MPREDRSVNRFRGAFVPAMIRGRGRRSRPPRRRDAARSAVLPAEARGRLRLPAAALAGAGGRPASAIDLREGLRSRLRRPSGAGSRLRCPGLGPGELLGHRPVALPSPLALGLEQGCREGAGAEGQDENQESAQHDRRIALPSTGAPYPPPPPARVSMASSRRRLASAHAAGVKRPGGAESSTMPPPSPSSRTLMRASP